MKRTKNSNVIQAWKRGEPARNHRNNLSTDGTCLWSYGLQIGARTRVGVTVLADYRASGKYRSQTTSCHVGLAERAGVDMIMHPVVWTTSPLSKDEEIPF